MKNIDILSLDKANSQIQPYVFSLPGICRAVNQKLYLDARKTKRCIMCRYLQYVAQLLPFYQRQIELPSPPTDDQMLQLAISLGTSPSQQLTMHSVCHTIVTVTT